MRRKGFPCSKRGKKSQRSCTPIRSKPIVTSISIGARIELQDQTQQHDESDRHDSQQELLAYSAIEPLSEKLAKHTRKVRTTTLASAAPELNCPPHSASELGPRRRRLHITRSTLWVRRRRVAPATSMARCRILRPWP